MTNANFKPSEETLKLASAYAEKHKTDICIYNGPIRRFYDISFIQSLASNREHDNLFLILVTNGGDADAAYKIACFIQDIYDKFTIFVTGLCKSAGTIISLAANEVVFSHFGELGPLDVQKGKEDRVGILQSGLVVTEALNTLENRATAKYFELISSIIQSSNTISFSSAATAAADLVHGLYAPMFSQIDPEDIGDKARSMKIGEDYGKRLSVVSNNLKPKALEDLVKTYSSHSFVIDYREATLLFNSVRKMNDEEFELMYSLQEYAILQKGKNSEAPIYYSLSKKEESKDEATKEEQSHDIQGETNSSEAPANTGGAAGEATIGAKRAGDKHNPRQNKRSPVAVTERAESA